MAVVPFGGGTSVVGGVEPVADGFPARDLARPAPTRPPDRGGPDLAHRDARGRACSGREAERLLAAEGVTLGHFPQSFEFSTVGGWVATRSAGQASTGYGRIDELVEGLRLVAPSGEVAPPAGARPRRRGRTCASC